MKSDDDRAFFLNIYDEYYEMMFECAFGYLKNYHDAEDAVQQVLLNLWKYIYNVKRVSEKKLMGYLYVTTKNHCCDLIKKNKRFAESFAECYDDYSKSRLMIETTPELIVIEKYDYSILVDAFNELQPRYRQIIMDKAILHLNDEQAAEHIKIKVTYVRECLCRARAALNRLYLEKVEASETSE